MIRGYTTIEQSQNLLELGLSPKSADMYYEPSSGFCTEPSEIKVGNIKYAHPRSIPSWSLAALHELIPEYIIENGYKYIFYMYKCDYNYGMCYEEEDRKTEVLFYVDGIDEITCTYRMILTLINRGYIKTE